MSLGCGEYLIVSNCLNTPYDHRKTSDFLLDLKKYIYKFGETCLLNIKPENASYDVLWNGEYEEIITDKFSIENLTDKFLSSLEIIFSNGIVSRLQLHFLDEVSYEISLIFNYTKLIEEEINKYTRITNATFIEDIALVMFERLEPIYGLIGQEISSSSLKSILLGKESLPLERAFYRKEFMEESVDFYTQLIDGKQFVKIIPNVGFYFRKNIVDDFSTLNGKDEKFDFSEGIKVIERL